MTGILNLLMGASSRPSDPFFEYTTLLLPGNGTNGAQNNTFLDGSTNNFTITRNGNTTQGTFSPFSQTGWSNYFPATSDTTENKISGTITAFGTGNFTVAFWVNIQGVTYSGGFATSQNIVDGQDMFLIQVNSSNQLQVVDRTTSTIVIAASSSTAIPYNQWTNVALIRSGTGTNQTKLYVNGTEVGSATISTNFTGTTLSLGSRFTSSGGIWGPLYGYLSNFIYVDSALSPTTPTSPYTNVSGTRLLTCQSNRFVDNSSSPVTLTATSNVSVVPFSPFNPTASWSAATHGGSGYFDGSGDFLGSIGTAANWAFMSNSTALWSLECWLFASSSTEQAIIDTSGGSSANVGLYVAKTTSNTIFLDIVRGVSGVRVIQAATTGALILNAWNHLLVTYDQSLSTQNAKIYINGGSAETFNKTANAPSGSDPTYSLRVGGFNGNTAATWNGYISSLRISNVVRSSSVPTTPYTSDANTSLLLNFTNAGIYDATSKNDLETVGNAQISTAISAKWGSGSMAFDGTGDWLQIPDSPLLNFGSGNFTIEFWAYWNAFGSDKKLIVKAVSSSNYWQLIHDSTSGIQFNYNTGSGQVIVANQGSNSGWSTGVWYYVAMVRSGNAITIYRDGSSVATGTLSIAMPNPAAPLTIGGVSLATADSLNGYMQDVRITNGYARTVTTSPTAAFPTL